MTNHPPYFYHTEIEWAQARRGNLRAPGLPALEVATPPEFKGHEGIWTPEHLFVASVNSCFVTTFLAVAELSGLEFTSFVCYARGRLEQEEGRGYHIAEIILWPKLIIRHERDAERAARLLEKADQRCLISNSIRTTVTLEPEITSEAIEQIEEIEELALA
jgi:organic hydroperoxide reductase OsmC/OhrA